MLNSKKLLYIFSDVAYVAELLPAKKQGDFTLQDFRQINGEYLNNDVFIAENIDKLFSKLEKEEYLLILPDFFFTNTIIEVEEKAKTKIDKHVAEVLLPSLDLREETHQLKHFVLTQYGEKSNVQLSAIEKSLLAPVYAASEAYGVKISKITSLSWTVKALISLEPSLSLVQVGENLHLAQHYIGLDQAISAPVTDVEKISETIKTLKGAQPSIQTIYLLTNELVESQLKELLKSTLPLQQLTDLSAEVKDVPTYVKQVIETGAKTLAVPEFSVPLFNLEKVDPSLVIELPKAVSADEAGEDEPLPEPKELVLPEVTTEEKEEIPEIEMEDKEPEAEPEVVVEPEVPIVPLVATSPSLSSLVSSKETAVSASSMTETQIVDDLFPPKDGKKETSTPAPVSTQTSTPIMAGSSAPKTVLKNKSGISSMLKMFFISVSVFFLTVGIGVGLGISYLTFSGANTPSPTPVVTTPVVVTPTPTPTPAASAAATLAKSEAKILIVNATTKAGYAGTIKKMLTSDEFTKVDTGNAKGDYKEGNFILMKEENQALIAEISTITKLTFSYLSEIETEDLKGSYDAVLVLNE